MAQQVKSKQRVQDHSEMFTSEREVNTMLDMVKQEAPLRSMHPFPFVRTHMIEEPAKKGM